MADIFKNYLYQNLSLYHCRFGLAALFALIFQACNLSSSVGVPATPQDVCTKFYETSCSKLQDTDNDGYLETEFTWDASEKRVVKSVQIEGSKESTARYDTLFSNPLEFYAVDSVFAPHSFMPDSFDLNVIQTHWHTSDRKIVRTVYEGSEIHLILEGRFGDDDVKDVLLWSSVIEGDTLLDGFGVYTYHENGNISNETQWVISTQGEHIGDTTLLLVKDYDLLGSIISRTEIRRGNRATTEEYNSNGLAIKVYSWSYEGSFTGLIQTDTLYRFYDERDSLAYTSNYSATTINDSAHYDDAGRTIEKWKYIEGKLSLYTLTTYKLPEGNELSGLLNIEYDETGSGVIVSKWLNSSRYITHIQYSGEEKTPCLEPLSRVECNTGTP